MEDNKVSAQGDLSPDNENIAAFPTGDAVKLPAIKEQAATWIVRINSGEFSAAEEQALAQWLAADALHHDTLFKLAKQWDSMAVLSDLAELFPLPNSELSKAANNTANNAAGATSGRWGGFGEVIQSYSLSRLSQSAFAFSVACLLAIVFIPAVQTTLLGLGAPHYVTAIGERSTFILKDGSMVTLNTNSELAVQFSEGRRDIHLSRGEASFDVAKNSERPFVVHAGEGVVWAVGTAFTVRYASVVSKEELPAVNVMVTEGAVKVFADVAKVSDAELRVDAQELQQAKLAAANAVAGEGGGQPVEPVSGNERESLLTVGQSLRYSEHIKAREQVAPAQIEKQLAWHQGVIIFEGETLERALQEVSRYTDKELRIIDPSIRDIPVGGHYKTGNIDALLSNLSEGFGIKVVSVGGNRVHLSAKR